MQSNHTNWKKKKLKKNQQSPIFSITQMSNYIINLDNNESLNGKTISSLSKYFDATCKT